MALAVSSYHAEHLKALMHIDTSERLRVTLSTLL
jgi:hypothetical protein